MKRIHPEDPRITQHALGELSHAEAREVEHAALLDPAVQEAIDETRQLAGLLDEVMGQGELALGEDRLAAIRSAGRSGNVVPLASAQPRRRWGRVAIVSSLAAGLMLATILILQQIPVEGGPNLADGGNGYFKEDTVMRLLLAPAPTPERVVRLEQQRPVAPGLPGGGPVAEGAPKPEWTPEYQALTKLLAKDPDRFFRNVERIARSADIASFANLPSLRDNGYVSAAQKTRAVVPVASGTASYIMVDRFIRGEKTLPPRSAVRVEELVNSITYEAGGDSELDGVRLGAELVRCPWNPHHLLLGVLLQNGSEDIIPCTAALQLDIKADLVSNYRLIGFADVDEEGKTTGREAAMDAGLAPGRSNYVIFELEPAADKDLEERWVMVRVGLSLGDGLSGGMIVPVMSPPREWTSASDNFQTAAVLAGYGLMLRDSDFKGSLDADYLTELAEATLASQRDGDMERRQALQLVIDSRIYLLGQ